MAKLDNGSPGNPIADYLGIEPQGEHESDHAFKRRSDKAYMKKNNLVWCPQCDGDGYFEVQTWLTYNGDVYTRPEECPLCHGQRWVDKKVADQYEEEET
jgi:excinuclease UvrABC ATPase subunit